VEELSGRPPPAFARRRPRRRPPLHGPAPASSAPTSTGGSRSWTWKTVKKSSFLKKCRNFLQNVDISLNCCNIFWKMLEEVKKWRKMLSNISKNVDKKYVGKLLKNVDEEKKCWQHSMKKCW
jgi:hypothetical protein